MQPLKKQYSGMYMVSSGQDYLFANIFLDLTIGIIHDVTWCWYCQNTLLLYPVESTFLSLSDGLYFLLFFSDFCTFDLTFVLTLGVDMAWCTCYVHCDFNLSIVYT